MVQWYYNKKLYQIIVVEYSLIVLLSYYTVPYPVPCPVPCPAPCPVLYSVLCPLSTIVSLVLFPVLSFMSSVVSCPRSRPLSYPLSGLACQSNPSRLNIFSVYVMAMSVYFVSLKLTHMGHVNMTPAQASYRRHAPIESATVLTHDKSYAVVRNLHLRIKHIPFLGATHPHSHSPLLILILHSQSILHASFPMSRNNRLYPFI